MVSMAFPLSVIDGAKAIRWNLSDLFLPAVPVASGSSALAIVKRLTPDVRNTGGVDGADTAVGPQTGDNCGSKTGGEVWFDGNDFAGNN